jgi:hypothetical protein
MAILSRRSLLAVVICSEPFLEMARAQARAFDVPDLPLIVVPHPLGGIPVDDVKSHVEVALPQLMKALQETTS